LLDPEPTFSIEATGYTPPGIFFFTNINLTSC
jgi:hypothetical protein